MGVLEIEQFICRSDNIGVLIHDPVNNLTAAIDAPEEAPILAALERRGWMLDYIFTTHHHYDHVEANFALKQKYGLKIYGPHAESDKIPEIDVTLNDGDNFRFGQFEVQVLSTPGHTKGEISYYIPQSKVAFTGDTLFSLGCGRLLEGTPQQMFRSLKVLSALPADTAIYCGHEYSASNARFALTIDPDNEALQQRAAEITHLRANDQLTLPTSIARELATNPFLRASDRQIRARLSLTDASDEQVFTRIRALKDNF
ncbi:hydroxyacylglutathione hydrolase [Paenochrobactrum gallinarii]|uniref:Hydroxyacylglutathione hydrolase n=1 Tax=Paenochrobactrum gallinarii TaxID=643673 RepID=A0A841M3D2_9HYPH|nr:hydroxyacylglutathione hydrolase [Paenochrobactrum gallinarii]MBB6260831.1 hydroxyacylglutathione hydrolase [Paenochrobactrum gallinarii]